MVWEKRGAAWVGSLILLDGKEGNAVLVGPRRNPRGAVLVFPGGHDSEVQTVPLSAGLELLRPAQVAEVVCMQERAFGAGDLPLPHESGSQP